MSNIKTSELLVKFLLVVVTALLTLGSVHFTTVSKVQENSIYISNIKEDMTENNLVDRELMQLMKSVVDQNNLLINSITMYNMNSGTKTSNHSTP